MVNVIDKDGALLMPTSRFGKVRRLLKSNKAKVVSKNPFTIKLLYEPETHIVDEEFLKENAKMKKRNGFTLIELVIVVAIIGILALMIIPQFTETTKDAKLKAFEGNYRTVVSAYGQYMAGNNGDRPTKNGDLDPYISGGMDNMKDNPTGTTYTIGTDGVFTATYKDASLDIDITKTYPDK